MVTDKVINVSWLFLQHLLFVCYSKNQFRFYTFGRIINGWPEIPIIMSLKVMAIVETFLTLT